MMVGFGPRRLVDTDGQIFVSNYKDGSLSVLIPGQLGALQEIFGLGEPLEMIFDNFYRRIYVADRSVDGLLVIDTNSNQLIRKISLGAKPLGLAIIQ
jgi:YVTN family beta-propeller protein